MIVVSTTGNLWRERWEDADWWIPDMLDIKGWVKAGLQNWATLCPDNVQIITTGDTIRIIRNGVEVATVVVTTPEKHGPKDH